MRSKYSHRFLIATAVPLLGLALLADAAAPVETILNQERLTEFLSRSTVIQLPDVTRPVQNPVSVLIKGVRSVDNVCKWDFTINLPSADFSPTKAYSTVETAWDPTTCEVVEQRGWREVPVATTTESSATETALTSTLPISGPSAETYTTKSTASTPIIGRIPEPLPCSGSAWRPVAVHADRVIGAYVEWTDANHPYMKTASFEIVTNWARAELNFKNNFCNSPGYQLNNASTKTDYCAATGWTTNGPPTAYLGYQCNFVCNATSCTATSGQAYSEVYANYTNSIFPGCSPGVNIHYMPVKVVANNDGSITFPISTTRTGVLTGCGEYLVQRRDLYER